MKRMHHHRNNSIVLAGALAATGILWPAILPAQQAPPPPAAGPSTVTTFSAVPAATRPTTTDTTHGGITTQPGGKLMINFKDASIDSVLDELSAVAGFIVIKQVPGPLQGRISLVSKQPISSDEAINLLNTVLKNAGYAAIQQGRILKIYPLSQAKKANIPVHVGADPSQIPATDELITQVIPLKQADAVQLKTDLTPLIDTTQADFTANASSNALVLTDTSANVKRVVEIVSALDQNLIGSAEVKVFQLQYASASAAAKLITDLFGENAQTSSNSRSSSRGPGGRFGFFSFGRGGRGGPAQGNESEGRQPVTVHASSDDRTNTVVVTGPPETLTVIEKVVKQLDSNPLAEDTVFIYHLKNADALNIQQVMNYLFSSSPNGGVGGSVVSNRSSAFTTNRVGSSSSGFGSGSNRFGSSGGSGSSGFGSSGFGSSGFGSSSFGSSGFGSSRGNSSSGRSSNGGGYGGLSQSSQQAAAGMAGQVTVIADPDTNSLLVRTGPKNYEQVKAILDDLDRPVAQVLIKVLIAEVTHDRSFDVGTEWSVLNLRGTTTDANGNVSNLGSRGGTDFGLKNLTGGLVVQTLEENIQATLRLLETEGKLDVLSRPYILASDNQLASITVGQEVPVVQNSRITDTGQTINTLQYQPVGILLDVVPHINTDGLVILDVAPEISSLTGQTVPISDTAAQPIIAQRSAQSRVGVMNGQTIVIGGLMQDQKTDTIQKVPLLGDIPWIGQVFKRTQTDKTKTELLIFITPHVAARPEILENMSKDEMGGMKLTPGAVGPGVFDEQMRGMQRGRTATTGSTTLPTSVSMPPTDINDAAPHPIRGGIGTPSNPDTERRRNTGDSSGGESGESAPAPAPGQGGSGGQD